MTAIDDTTTNVEIPESDEKKITIRRAAHTSRYFPYSRTTAQDPRLSFEALGVLTYLLSKPDDWLVRPEELRNHGKIGRDKINRILGELIKTGYLHKSKQKVNANKTFASIDYVVYEEAMPVDEPFTENPSTDEPSTENPQLTYNRSNKIQKKDSMPRGGKPVVREREPIYDAVTKYIYGGVEQPFRVGTLTAWMKGGKTTVTQNRATCTVPVLDPPATVDEIGGFPIWMLRNHPNIDVRQPTVVIEYFLRMRQQVSQKPNGAQLGGMNLVN